MKIQQYQQGRTGHVINFFLITYINVFRNKINDQRLLYRGHVILLYNLLPVCILYYSLNLKTFSRTIPKTNEMKSVLTLDS